MNHTRLMPAAVLIGALLTAVPPAAAPAAGGQSAAPQPEAANRGWDDAGTTVALGALPR
ncbi:hypothetical protein [Pseudonocardia acidicola]|uniref:Uncharacterized protein n=1 Tax=Pseudonocardia acidicola TaxID=2724939 RepID=A0ABX1S824_9PSEU|nr:hypothetical protein [Pseudonocardia acidicola]NMH97701.1 hypothetical protein [Pseudonocardia acidicola]